MASELLVSLRIRTLTLLDQGSAVWPHLTLITSAKAPFPNTATRRPQGFDLGIWGNTSFGHSLWLVLPWLELTFTSSYESLSQTNL